MNWNDFSGEFRVSFDSVVLAEKLEFGLYEDGKTIFHLPMFESPLSTPASYCAIKISDNTYKAILKGLHRTFSRLKKEGIDRKTGKFIVWSTPPIERTEKSILEQAKAKFSKTYSITIEL